MKYEINICSCGRIHALDAKKVSKAIDKNKNFIFICAGCGTAVKIGADIYPDLFDPKATAYDRYCYDFSKDKDTEINPDFFKATKSEKEVDTVLYSQGYRVPMKTGQYATDYFNGIFSDRWYPDFWKIQRKDITVKEIMDFIDEYNRDRSTVNMRRFINETPDDVLDELSNYVIDGLDFTGTKYERK